MMTVEVAHHLRMARMGHVLLESVPGAALRVGRVDGPSVVVAAVGDPRAEVLPCQHRAALTRALASGVQRTYACALGLVQGGDLTVELVAPSGTDLGNGVFARDEGSLRRLCAVTTLCPAHASSTIRAARTVPIPAHDALTQDPGRADLRLDLAHDPALGVTLMSWLHRPHPAVVGPMEDLARAASAACVVEELLQTLR